LLFEAKSSIMLLYTVKKAVIFLEKNNTELEQLLDVEQVATILNVHRETAARYIREKKISSTIIGGGAVRVHPQDLVSYIDKQRKLGSAKVKK